MKSKTIRRFLWQQCKEIVSAITTVAFIAAVFCQPAFAASTTNAPIKAQSVKDSSLIPFSANTNLLGSVLVLNDLCQEQGMASEGVYVLPTNIFYQKSVGSDTYLITSAGESFRLISQSDEIFLVSINGTVYQVVSDIVAQICFAGAVLIVGGIIIYQLWKCIKKVLYPAPNPPPPPPPPPPTTNSPPKKAQSRFISSDDISYTAGFGLNELVLQPGCSPQYALTDDQYWQYCMDISGSNWVDWKGNPFVLQSALMVTNTVVINANGTAMLCFLQSSADMVTWTNESYTITFYMSSSSLSAAMGGIFSNIVVIQSDLYGNAFETNWSSLNGSSPQTQGSTVTVTGFPKRAGNRLFWRYKLVDQ
jgi:hypothetical protein